MKKLLIISALAAVPLLTWGQTASDYINNAKKAYSSSDYEEARFNLQNALNEIDKLIAKEILNSLPTKLGELAYIPENDASTGTGSMVLGLYVNRYYGKEDGKNAEISIADNSPLMGMVSTFLNNPMLSGIAGMASDQKVVKVDGYKGMLQLNEEDGTYSLMVPFGDSLFSLQSNITEESEIMGMANQVSISKIVSIVD